MPYVSIFSVKGDPDELAATKREKMDPVVSAIASKHGHIAQIAAKTEEGLLIINVWQTQDGADSMAADPDLKQAWEKAGMPARSDREHYELLDFRQFGELATD